MLGAIAVSLSIAMSSTGSEDEPRTLFVPADAPAAFVLRLQGQLSDLRWRVERARDEQTHRPRAWLESAGPDLSVVLEGNDGRRFVRTLRGLGRGAAALEAAALALRLQLGALEGAHPSPEAPALPKREEADPWGARGSVRVETWGLGPWTPGVDAGVFRRLGLWAIDLGGSARWPQTVEDSLTRSRLGRYELSLGLRRDFRLRRGLAVGGVLRGGIALWHRSTEAVDLRAVPRPGGVVVGGLVRAELAFLVRLSDHFGLELAVGADALPGAPRYVYAGSGSADPAASPVLVQPSFSLGVRFDSLFARALPRGESRSQLANRPTS